MSKEQQPLVGAEQFFAYLRKEDFYGGGSGLSIERWELGRVSMRMAWRDVMARPGGTVSGPVQFALADLVMWALMIGADPDGFHSVTTDMNMHFLRAVGARDLIGEGRLLRAGRKLAVSEVTIFADGEDEPICHATGTYAFRRSISRGN